MQKLGALCLLFTLAAAAVCDGPQVQSKKPKKSEPAAVAEPPFKGKSLEFWPEELKKSDSLDVEEAIAVLADAGPAARAALPALTQALKSETQSVRFQAAIALWKIGNKTREVVPALVEVLKDANSGARMLAIQTVGEMGPDAKEAAPYLFAALSDSNVELGQSAGLAFAQMGAEAVPFLVKGLGLADPTIRQGTAGAIGHLPPTVAKTVTPKLKALLTEQDPQVRYAAAQALWRLEHRADDIVGALESVIGNTDVRLHKSAADLFCRIRPRPQKATKEFAMLLKDQNLALRVKGAEALWDIHHDPKEVLPVLLEILKDPKVPFERIQAGALLARMGPGAKEFWPQTQDELKVLLGQPNPPPLHDIVRAVGPDASPLVVGLVQNKEEWARPWRDTLVAAVGADAIPAVLKLVNHQDSQVREAAIVALGMAGPATPEVVPTLIAVTRTDKVQRVRQMAIENLIHIGPSAKSAVPLLIALLSDNQSPLRWQALNTLSSMRIGDKSALPALEEAVSGGISPYSVRAAELRWKIDRDRKKAVATYVDFVGRKELRVVALDSWARHGELFDSSEPDLVDRKALSSMAAALADQACRKSAAICLGLLGPQARPALPNLMALLSDQNPEVRRSVAEAVRRIGGDAKAAAESLRPDLQITELNSAAKAHEIIRSFAGDAKSLASEVRAHLGDKLVEHRLLAAETLCVIDQDQRDVGRHALLDALSTATPLQRMRAAFALCHVDGVKPRYLDVLVAGLTDPNPTARRFAALWLGHLGKDAGSATPSLLLAFDDELPQVRMLAAWALCKVGAGPRPAVGLLLNYLRDTTCAEFRKMAASLLGELGPEAMEAVPALVESLGDRFQPVRVMATDALQKIDPQAIQNTGLSW